MAENNSSAPLLPWPPAIDELPEAVIDAVAAALGDAYDCHRVWSAWSYGTMGPDDFGLVAEDGERIAEIARAAIEAYVAVTQAVEAQAAPAAVAVTEAQIDAILDEPGGMIFYVSDQRQKQHLFARRVLALATQALPATEDSLAGDLAEPMFPKANFGLGAEDIDKMRDAGLKPEEIASDDPETQLRRVHELVWWFSRFADGNANPKWLRGHAFELAYYIACMDVKRQINLDEVRKKAFKEGAMVSPSERSSLEFTGFLPPLAAPQAEVQAEPLCWVFEDELPESLTTEAYNALFAHSKVDGVRMFPVFGPQAAPQAKPADALDAAPAAPINSEALQVIKSLREWVMAVPADVAAALPAMPGIDADWMDAVEAALATHSAPADGLMVDMTPPATSRDRWMYNQGRLAEVERICAAIKTEDDYCVDQGDYMLDSDDCIKVARGTWLRPTFDRAAMAAAQEGGKA